VAHPAAARPPSLRGPTQGQRLCSAWTPPAAWTSPQGKPPIHASALTLALPKVGLLGTAQVGRLYLAAISVPPLVYGLLGLEVGHPFATQPVIELDDAGQPR
jgi:hypothetical protein